MQAKDSNKTWSVYAHINNINNMVYVGITTNIHRRWHSYAYKGCTKFYNAITKFGWDNFTHIVIMDNLSYDVAGIIEKELIKKYDLINRGYNTDIGGHHPDYKAHGRPKNIYQYDLNGNYIRSWDNAKQAAKTLGLNYTSLCAAARQDEYYKTNGGYQWRYELFEKIEPYIEFSYRKKYPPIAKFDTFGNYICTYDNIWEVENINGTQVHSIIECCNHRKKSMYNYLWLWESEVTKENIDNVVYEYNNRWYGYQIPKRICWYTLGGELIQVFESCTEASKITGVNYDSIQGACNAHSKHHQACGYLWYYYDDVDGSNVVNPYNAKSGHQPVLQFNKDGKFINKYMSKNAANKAYKGVRSRLDKSQYYYNDYIWIYESDFKKLKNVLNLENYIVDE